MTTKTRRIICGAFALILVTATHWPKLQIAAPIPRPDLIAHIGAFGLWTSLAIRARLFGTALSRRNVALTSLLAASYAAIDEVTQGFPGLGRTVAVSDWLANLAGVAMAARGAIIVGIKRQVPMTTP